MVKHRRLSDKPKDDSVQKEEKMELIQNDIQSKKEPIDIKSIIQSGSKYIYIVAAAALLSGIFTPFTINAEITIVYLGILSIFLGLGGGILIFLATKNQKFRSIMVCGGLGMMIISLILIYELADRSIIQ
tara:strand:- start:54 stop:443 length:390 start_codon:yes stop_codon:yes gene_type:complete